MKNSQKIEIDQLKKLSLLLNGNWRYNAILTAEERYRGHYLTNGAGLIINVGYSYGYNLPQWKIQYFHPTHKETLITFFSIGCSLNKSNQAISIDIKNRLLPHISGAYKELEKLVMEEGIKQNIKQLDLFVINSLKKVMRLNHEYNHSYIESYRIENNEGIRIASIGKWSSKSDCFDLKVENVDADKIIKIMEIVNS